MSKIEKLQGMLVYCKLDKAIPCFVESKGTEWKAGVVVDEDTADAFNEIYPKQSAKKIKCSDFEELYKVAPLAEWGKNAYVITLRKNTKLANGNDVPDKYKPRVFQKKGNSLVDITHSILPANGSMGVISVEHYEGKMGAVARLKNVLVTELIEYEKKPASEYESGSEFEDAKPSKEQKEEKEVKPKGKVKQAEPDDDLDSDLPF